MIAFTRACESLAFCSVCRAVGSCRSGALSRSGLVKRHACMRYFSAMLMAAAFFIFQLLTMPPRWPQHTATASMSRSFTARYSAGGKRWRYEHIRAAFSVALGCASVSREIPILSRHDEPLILGGSLDYGRKRASVLVGRCCATGDWLIRGLWRAPSPTRAREAMIPRSPFISGLPAR